MEEFNFDAPINAIVIFDDSSDDESNEKKTNIQALEKETKPKNDSCNKLREFKNKEKSTENNLSKPKRELLLAELKKPRRLPETKALKSTIIKEKCPEESTRCTKNLNSLCEAEKSPKKKQKSLDMPLLEDDNNNLQNVNVLFSEFDHHGERLNSDERNKKRKNSTNSQRIPKRRRTKNSQLKTVDNTTETHDPNKGGIGTNKNTLQGNNLIYLAENNTNNSLSLTPDINTNGQANGPSNATYKELEQTNLYSAETLRNFNLHSQQQSTTASNQPNTEARTFSQSLNEINHSISSFIIDSLNTVSEHIISILVSYRNLSYVRSFCKDINSHPNGKEHVRSFIRRRNHFFDLSYSTVVNIIIPGNANDNTLALNFIENTKKMAISKLLPFTRADIVRVYNEMIAWVKQKHEQMKIMNLNQMHYPLLALELQKPTYPPTNSKSYLETYTSFLAYEQNHNSPSTASSIQNILPALGENIQVGYGKTWHPSMQDPQMNILPPPPPYIDKRINDLKNSSNRNCTQILSSGPPRCNMQYYDAAHYNGQAVSTQVHNPILEPPQNGTKTNQNQLYEKQGKSFNFLYSQNGSMNTVQGIASQLNSDTTSKLPSSNAQSAQNQMINSQKCPQSSQNYISGENLLSNNQEMDLRQYDQLSRAENSTQAEQSRSISRDSGVISPPYFNNNNDPALQCDSQEGSPYTTPLITHVTSLNPNVSYIVDGWCTVCGKTTKQMCIGCYKCYYCSHACQNSDWKNHQIVCKIISK